MATKKATTKSSQDSTEKAKRVPVDDMPAVRDYLDVKEKLDAVRVDYADVFRVYDDLVLQHNTALELAGNQVRAEVLSCGPFENFSVSTVFDAQKMYDELGEELYLKCGGSIGKVATYTVDTAVLKAAIASGKVPADCVDSFRTIQRSYHTPKKITG